MISRPQGSDSPRASSVAGTSVDGVVRRIAERYGLAAGHWGRSGTAAGVWGVDQHGWVTFVWASDGLRAPAATSDILALEGERLTAGAS